MPEEFDLSIRYKLRSLGKGEVPDSPLFIPLIFSMGTQVEAISAEEFSYNPTKIVKGLTELRDALGFGVVTPAYSLLSEVEALGGVVDWSSYPPSLERPPLKDSEQLIQSDLADRLLCAPRIVSSVESTRRIRATSGKDTLLVAYLTGTATLARQLIGNDLYQMSSDRIAAVLEYCGRCMAGYVRQLGAAGTQVVVIHEPDASMVTVDYQEAWLASLRPVVNVAKFHRSLITIIPDMLENTILCQLIDSLTGAIWCPPIESFPDGGAPTLGISMESDPDKWIPFPPGVGLVVTRGETSPQLQIPALKTALLRQVT